MKGPELKKNELATDKMEEILRECVWINIHVIVHKQVLIEARTEAGYGLRWSGDTNFRGFLEP